MKDLYKNGIKYYVFDHKRKSHTEINFSKKHKVEKIKLLTDLFSCDKMGERKKIKNKKVKREILENNSKDFPEVLEYTKFSFNRKENGFVINFIVNL